MNGLRAAFSVMKNDLLLNRAKPMSTVLAILIPLNFLILFSLFALSGARVPVAVFLGDSGRAGAAMVQSLQSTHTFRMTIVHSPEEGAKAIANQTSVASVRIPSDLAKALRGNGHVRLPVTLNNLNSDFADDIRRGLPLGILNFYQRSKPSSLPFGWKEVDSYSHNTSFLAYLAVSIQTVALLLGGILLSGRGTAGEWERGTIKELKLAPVSTWSVILGKLATGFVNGLISALLVFVALLALGVYPIHWVQFFLILFLTLFVFVCIGLAIGILVRSQFVIYPFVLGVALPLFFISGAFGPISWSTPAAAWVARLFPVVYANAAFQRAVHGYWPIDTPWAIVWMVLAIWAAVALIISTWAYQRATAAH